MQKIAEERRTLGQLVYSSVRQAILTGELKSGELLREADLAARLGVSKTPVREALRKLEREALARSVAHRGVVVAGLESHDIRDIFEMRVALEPLAARLAAERITDAEASALRALLDDMRVAARRKDRERLRGLNVEFHARLHALSGNKRLERTLGELQEYIHTTRTVEWTVPGGFDRNHELHVVIGEAVVGRRPDEAEARMREHISRALELLVERHRTLAAKRR